MMESDEYGSEYVFGCLMNEYLWEVRVVLLEV